MYVFVVCVRRCTCVQMHACKEARDWHWVSFLIDCHPILLIDWLIDLRPNFLPELELTSSTRWSNGKVLRLLPLCCWGYTHVPPCLTFYMGAKTLNSGPYGCVVSIKPTEPALPNQRGAILSNHNAAFHSRKVTSQRTTSSWNFSICPLLFLFSLRYWFAPF